MKVVQLFIKERQSLIQSLNFYDRRYNLLFYSIFLYFLYISYWYYTCFLESYNFKGRYMLVLYGEIPIIIVVTLLNIFYQILYRYKFKSFEKQRINKRDWPWEENPEKWKKDLPGMLIRYITNYFIVSPIVAAIFCYFKDMDIGTKNFPSFSYFYFLMVLTIFVDDFFFYWIHRILHHPKFYWIHKEHHELNILTNIGTVNANCFEYFWANSFPSVAALAILGPIIYNPFIVSAYVTYRIWQAEEQHCGYEFKYSIFKAFPFCASNEYHNYHHDKNNGNYAIFFTFWDHLFGTNQPYYELKNKQYNLFKY